MREEDGRARAQKERGERIGAHVVVQRPCVGRPAPLEGFKRRFAGRKLRMLEAFRRLARVPMLLIYGDNIAEKPCALVGPDKWRSELDMARKFVAAVNRHGGRAELLHLPDIGIRGNTHFLMSDLNNREIAELVDAWLKKRVPGAVKA